jgi:hypothetical protein
MTAIPKFHARQPVGTVLPMSRIDAQFPHHAVRNVPTMRQWLRRHEDRLTRIMLECLPASLAWHRASRRAPVRNEPSDAAGSVGPAGDAV